VGVSVEKPPRRAPVYRYNMLNKPRVVRRLLPGILGGQTDRKAEKTVLTMCTLRGILSTEFITGVPMARWPPPDCDPEGFFWSDR